jgi:hypothetical protein
LSDLQILIFATSTDANGSLASVELLRNVAVPNASKFVVVTGKFETQEARKFNIEADYPAEPAQLQTIAAWAGLSHGPDSRLRDGYDLFCLRSIVKKQGPFSHAVLLRHVRGFEGGWADLAHTLGDKLFMVFGAIESQQTGNTPQCNVLFRLDDGHSIAFIEQAFELYSSGTVYAFEDYSFDIALGAAAESLRFQQRATG